MLPKNERLSRVEFNRFFSLGKRSHSPAFQLVYTPHTHLHVSVVVSKKIAKSAVQRNKIRRRIYDIVRHYRDEEGVSGVFIFLAKEKVVGLSYEHLKNDIRSCMQETVKSKR